DQIQRHRINPTGSYRSYNRVYVCKPCHILIHQCIKQYGESLLVQCEICGRITVTQEHLTFQMCPDCLERERQLKLQSEAFANLRIEISNELTGLEPPKELAGEKSMAVNEKFVDEHVAFWNEENKLIQDMNMQELDARIEEWEKIYREAKTKLSADRELKRNRIANLSKEERDKLLNPNANPQDSRLVTDSI